MNSLVVGICGASSSGKTWLTQQLCERFDGSSEVIGQDGYYRDNAAVQKIDFRHDNPESIDFDALIADVKRLLSSGTTNVPVYDYTIHAVAGSRPIQAPQLLVVEGHLLFASPALCELCDFKILVTAQADLRLRRRLQRDIEERGRDAQDVQHRFASEAEPAYQRYMHPLETMADAVYVNDGSPAAQAQLSALVARITQLTGA